MLRVSLAVRGDDLVCTDLADGGASTRRPLSDEALARLRGWAAKYDAAVRARNTDSLAAIGRGLAEFLNAGDSWLDRVLDGTGEIDLEIGVSAIRANRSGRCWTLLGSFWLRSGRS